MTQAAIKIGIVGLGKIARDQHVPALRADPQYALLGATSRAPPSPPSPHGLRIFADLGTMLDSCPDIEAVSFCTPPQGRYALARLAVDRGLHVMLEKPPGATLSEIADLAARARLNRVALFASWHSRAAPAVERARSWLAQRSIDRVLVLWKEDVRRWHPGQTWIWQPGGLGVFDPGINALSVLTRILPQPIFLTEASLYFPANRQTPIAASLKLSDSRHAAIEAQFDFRQTGEQHWDIIVDTDAGRLTLREGGALLQIDGSLIAMPPAAEYPALYRHFADLVRARQVEVDLAPLQLVADAFLLGRREAVEPFID